MEARSLPLATAFRHVINESNVAAGFDRFVALISGAISCEGFCRAAAVSLCDRLIREPIHLPDGALHCHGHLDLTHRGVAAAQECAATAKDKQSVQNSCTLC